ncbi:hypothetical protein SDC9_98090 [bioreactor metagenome]|uniref:Uncharacterized protein n=1 Tax=bioreactor metagenome TaxID=1076179 RepID=A0A645ADQ3_9ZZZZ
MSSIRLLLKNSTLIKIKKTEDIINGFLFLLYKLILTADIAAIIHTIITLRTKPNEFMIFITSKLPNPAPIKSNKYNLLLWLAISLNTIEVIIPPIMNGKIEAGK